MKSAKNLRFAVLLTVVFLTIGALPASAEFVFETSMTGDQVAPPSGSTGYGFATAILNNALTQVSYTINFAGLEAAHSAVGFYLGEAGTNGTLVLPLPNTVPQAGIWDVTPEIAQAILAEELYVCLFSDNGLFPDGELRGNFTTILVEAEATTLDAVKSLYR